MKIPWKNNELQKNFHEISSGTSSYIHGILLDPELRKLLVGFSRAVRNINLKKQIDPKNILTF